MRIYFSSPDKRYFYGKKDINFIKYKVRDKLSTYKSQYAKKYDYQFFGYVNKMSQDAIYANINRVSYSVTFFPFFRANFERSEYIDSLDLDLRAMMIILTTFKNNDEIFPFKLSPIKRLNVKEDLYVIKLGATKNARYMFKKIF